MSQYTLEIKLLSDTTFSMGAGVSGLVDSEIQQDRLGLPTLSGRTIKGLLVNECSELLYILPEAKKAVFETAAARLFGSRGDLEEESGLYIGDAGMAPDLIAYLAREENKLNLLDALTDIRRQTAVNDLGAPEDESLRAIRVLIRGITLYAPLILTETLNDHDQALLVACVLSLRRAGLGRTRGKGKIQVSITDRPLDPQQFAAVEMVSDLTTSWFDFFKKEVSS